MLYPAGVARLSPFNNPDADVTTKVIRGNNQLQIATAIALYLQSAPQLNGAPLRFVTARGAGAGNGATFAVELVMSTKTDGTFEPSNVGVGPIQYQDEAQADPQWAVAWKFAADNDFTIIGTVCLGGGAGASFLSLVFTTPRDPAMTGYIPYTQADDVTLVDGDGQIVGNFSAQSRVIAGPVTKTSPLGVQYVCTVTPGTPGAIDIEAVDATGAHVLDNNTLHVIVVTEPIS